jgi:type IV pilus assembly protein PilB
VQAAFTTALLRDRLITASALQSAVWHADHAGLPIHEAVVALGFVDERTSYRQLAVAADLRYVEAHSVVPSPLALRLVPERVARRHELLPVAVDDRTVTYVTATPYDVEADKDVSFATGRMPVAALSCASELRGALERVYPNRPDIQAVLAKARARSVVEPIDAISVDAPSESATIELCNMLIAQAVDAGASDLHLDPSESGILVRLRVGGVLESAMTLPPDVSSLARNRFKVMARVDIAVRQRPQDGAFGVRVSGRRIDVRLSTLPTTSGEKIVMRIIDSQSDFHSLDSLGYPADLVGRLRHVLDRPDGLLLVTGPTGSGKTTALYAALHHLRDGRVNIVSVEDPVERELAGVNQIPLNPRAGATFASVLRSVLRQDPNVLMVGEIRDAEVASIVGQAAFTGHLVLSSVHTLDAATAVTRLLNLGLEPFRVAETLTGILAQRLVRRLCPRCQTLGDDGATAGAGCPHCNHTGFVDRVPVVELLTPTDEIRTAIAKGATAVEIRQAMRDAGAPSMRDHAQALVAAGVTSAAEVGRVLGADETSAYQPRLDRPTVLIADDEPITRMLVRLLLERDGYAVIEAHNGRRAVDLALRHRPELIVMDLNMPQMTGYDAIAELRRTPGFTATPIVVVTAEEGPAVEHQVLALGADDYIVKPFEPAVLTARVKAVFTRQRLAA